MALQFLNLKNVAEEADEAGSAVSEAIDFSLGVSAGSKMGLRMVMTLIPIAGLIFALLWFKKRYILTDQKVEEIAQEVKARKSSSEAPSEN